MCSSDLDGRRRYTDFTLDIDSLPIPVHGHQDGSAYNGYYQTRCYHPLILGSAASGQLLGAILRPGNVGTADNAPQDLSHYLDWIQTHLSWMVTVRGDAGFPSDDMLCTDRKSTRLNSNHVVISYAVFCLKKKTPTPTPPTPT